MLITFNNTNESITRRRKRNESGGEALARCHATLVINFGFLSLRSGWMEKPLFFQWFEQMFLPHTKDLPRPLLLILDGHKSHFQVETLNLAVTHQV